MSISPSRGFYASDDDGSSWYQIGGGDPIERFDGGIVIDRKLYYICVQISLGLFAL